MSKASRNREIARAKVAEMRAAEARRARQRTLFTWIGAGVLAIAVAAGITFAVTAGNTSGGAGSAGSSPGASSAPALGSLGRLRPAPSPGPDGFEGVPIPAAPPLAGRAAAATGQVVDGIRCQSSEQSLFHIHSHLTIFVNGAERQVPAGIGIPGSATQNSGQGQVAAGGSCLYWLHTHAPDGIIHVESPVHRTFTLGDFFDEWGLPLSQDQLGPATGHVVAIVNGRVFLGNPRHIPLDARTQIQLEVGKPLIAPQTVTFPNGL